MSIKEKTSKTITELSELEALIGENDFDWEKKEKIVLSQELEGFAKSFPDWDLHPPVE